MTDLHTAARQALEALERVTTARCTDMDATPILQAYEAADAAITALRAALEAQQEPAQPQGWVLVPEDPTPEMRNAFHAVTDSESTLKGAAGSRWAAMLAARPQPKETT